MDEIFIHILTGVFLIVVGLLVKRFPMLIAGYNTMPAEKKKNVDVAGLSSFMRRHLVIIGALWVLLAVVLNLTGQQDALPEFTFRSTSSGCWSGRSGTITTNSNVKP